MEYCQMTHLLSLAVLNVYEMYVIHSNYNKFKVYKLLHIHIFQKPQVTLFSGSQLTIHFILHKIVLVHLPYEYLWFSSIPGCLCIGKY